MILNQILDSKFLLFAFGPIRSFRFKVIGKSGQNCGMERWILKMDKIYFSYVTNGPSSVQPVEEYQSVTPCEEQHNVCSESVLIYSDGSSFCVLRPQPCNASAPDQTKMLWVHSPLTHQLYTRIEKQMPLLYTEYLWRHLKGIVTVKATV